MTSRKQPWTILPLPLLALLTMAACSNDGPSAPDPTPDGATARLVAVEPPGGSVGVGLDAPVTVEFDHAMDPATSSYVDLHAGDLAGPVVPGTWEWLDGHTRLRFTPSGAFEPASTYAIHVGGGMMDEDGRVVDLETHGGEMGGAWATDTMMGGAMGGQMDPADHMGGAWDHPSNGSHGMAFVFTTGS